MFINRNIKTIRKISGLTQSQFAKVIGINLGSLKNYENTDVCPKLPAVLSICRVSGIEPEDLRSAEVNPSSIKFCLNREKPGLTNEDEQEERVLDMTSEGGQKEELEDQADLLKFLQSNDEFFKNQYSTFNVQVLANLSLLIDQTKKLEMLAKMNLAQAQKIERLNTNKPSRMINLRRQKA